MRALTHLDVNTPEAHGDGDGVGGAHQHIPPVPARRPHTARAEAAPASAGAGAAACRLEVFKEQCRGACSSGRLNSTETAWPRSCAYEVLIGQQQAGQLAYLHGTLANPARNLGLSAWDLGQSRMGSWPIPHGTRPA